MNFGQGGGQKHFQGGKMPLLPPLEKTLPLESVSGEHHHGSIPYSLKRERDIATAGEARESAGALPLDS